MPCSAIIGRPVLYIPVQFFYVIGRREGGHGEWVVFVKGVPFTIGRHTWAFHCDLSVHIARCPGKMASEEQCSAPPQWRSISLTHVEFPAGKCSQRTNLVFRLHLSVIGVQV